MHINMDSRKHILVLSLKTHTFIVYKMTSCAENTFLTRIPHLLSSLKQHLQNLMYRKSLTQNNIQIQQKEIIIL